MGNEVSIDLVVRGEKAAARGIKNVGDAADNAGDDLQKMAKDAGVLDKRIGDLKGELRGLITEFARTGDLDIKKKIKVESRELSFLTRARKQLSDLVDDGGEVGVKVGAKFGKSFLKSAAESLAGSKALLIGGLIGVGIAVAPLLGAAVGGAVLGAAGAGGIIGGIALAAQDARVRDAATSLGQHIAAVFTRAGEPLVAPTVEALGLLRGVASDVASDLRQGFATVAPVLLPLTRGLSNMIDEIMPGLQAAFVEAKPAIRALANELPGIGRSISDFFSEIAEESDGAIMGLVNLLKITQAVIRGTGQFIGIMSNAFEKLVRGAAAAAPVLEGLYGWLPIAGDMIKSGRIRADETLEALRKSADAGDDFAGSLDDIGDSASKAEKEILDLQSALDKAFGQQMDAQQATIRYEKSWDDLIETLHEGKKTLDAGTEAGRENRGAILDNIQAIKDKRDINIAEKMSVAEANAIYDQQIEKLRKAAIAHGLNKAEVNALIDAFDSLPRDVELELRVKGLRGVIDQVKVLSALLGSKAAASASIDGSYVSGRAHGGPVMPGQTYVVGENGPEVLQMGGSGGHVYNNQQSQAMMSGAVSGGSTPTVIQFVGDGSRLAALWLEVTREIVRVQGRGNVQLAFGR